MIKKYFVLSMCFIILVSVSGCGDTKNINGITYDTYGVFNEGYKNNESIEYRCIVGNVVWSIILSETLIAPFYFIGYSLFEPVEVRTNIKGKI